MCAQPVRHATWSESVRPALSLVRDRVAVNHVQSFVQPAVRSVQPVRHAVGDHTHVARQCRDKVGQFRRSSETVVERPMPVDEIVAGERPAVGRMRFLDVDDDEVGEVGVVGRRSTDVVEVGRERRSGAAAEDDDERPRASPEVQETLRHAVQPDYITVDRRTSLTHRLPHVQNATAQLTADAAPRQHRVLRIACTDDSNYMYSIYQPLKSRSHGVIEISTTLPHAVYALQIPTRCLLLVFTLPLPPVVLVLQPPQSGTHSHLAFATLPLPMPFVAFLKLTASSRPSAPPSDSPKCLSIGHGPLADIVHSIHLLT